MDIGKSFSYVFEDPNWVAKVAIGGAILLVGTILSIIIIGPIIASILLFGYMLTALKNVADGDPTPLPQWNDYGGFFMKGLYAAIGAIVIFLPAILIYACVALVSIALSGAAANDNSGSTGGAIGLVVLCGQCLGVLYSILAGLYLYAPLTRFAQNNQLSTFWDFSGNFAFIRQNAGNYAIAFVLTLVASIIASFGIIACFIGVFFTQFWSMLVTAHLFGQVARNSTGVAGPAPMAPFSPPPMAPVGPA